MRSGATRRVRFGRARAATLSGTHGTPSTAEMSNSWSMSMLCLYMCRPEVYVVSRDSAAAMSSSAQSQLLADLEDAVREFPAALCDIKDLRGEMHYLVCNFPGLEVKALYDVASRYTETTIVTEPTGNGQDRHVIKSKHTAAFKSGPVAWWLSCLTLRNVVTLLVTLLSLTNLFMTSPIFAGLVAAVVGGGGGGDNTNGANATKTPNTTAGSAPPTSKGSGFSLFN